MNKECVRRAVRGPFEDERLDRGLRQNIWVMGMLELPRPRQDNKQRAAAAEEKEEKRNESGRSWPFYDLKPR